MAAGNSRLRFRGFSRVGGGSAAAEGGFTAENLLCVTKTISLILIFTLV